MGVYFAPLVLGLKRSMKGCVYFHYREKHQRYLGIKYGHSEVLFALNNFNSLKLLSLLFLDGCLFRTVGALGYQKI